MKHRRTWPPASPIFTWSECWGHALTVARFAAVFALFVWACSRLCACATLRTAERAPCPPTALASIDARFAAEAIATCKAEHATADTCKALPGIRAEYAAERAAWVECKQVSP